MSGSEGVNGTREWLGLCDPPCARSCCVNNGTYELLRTLVCRFWDFSRALRGGGVFVESGRGEDGADFGRDVRGAFGVVGGVDVAGVWVGAGGGVGEHLGAGRGVCLAVYRGMDGLCGGGAEAFCGVFDYADVGSVVSFARRALAAVTAAAEGSRRVGDAAPYLSGKSCVFAAWKAVTLSPHSKILRWGCFGVRRLDAAFVDAGVVERTSPGTATLQFRVCRRRGRGCGVRSLDNRGCGPCSGGGRAR